MAKLIWADEIDEELRDLPEIKFNDNAPGLESLTPEQIRELSRKATEQICLMLDYQDAVAKGQIH